MRLWILVCEDNRGWTFSIEEVYYGLWPCSLSRRNCLKLKHLNNVSLTNTQLLLLGLLMWCFYQLFELSFWRHPFTAEDPVLSKWSWHNFYKFVPMKKQTHLHLWWPGGEYIFIFWVNCSFNMCKCYCSMPVNASGLPIAKFPLLLLGACGDGWWYLQVKL